MNLKFSEARNKFFFARGQPQELHFREGMSVINFLESPPLHRDIWIDKSAGNVIHTIVTEPESLLDYVRVLLNSKI
jgi:hypothetical protein